MKKTDILIVGGGAAGLSAAAEAASYGAKVTVLESDLHLGGQLVKQTHKFFGSKDEHAGTRGYKIADIILKEIEDNKENVEVHTNTAAVGFYKNDGIVTVMSGEESYFKLQ
ncbi:MAG: FAD-dependent oxidoreductase, partial [Synergistaceae bacterium]|nr:FAD-dependent oxidoreductase [Synergistaceae bacterium]